MSGPEPNPYTPGQVPRVLAGRHSELERIRDQTSRVVAFGEVGGPPLVFHAPRGLGKTSLLRAAQRQAEEVGLVCVWVACSRERPFLPELLHNTRRALEAAEVPDQGPMRRRWRTRLDRISVELGVPGLKVRGDLATPSTRPPDDEGQPSPATAPIGALEDLLHTAARMVRERHGAGLALFLDELHAASPDDLSILLNAMQNLDGQREENPLALITAGLPVTPEAIIRAATFGERSSFVSLDVLREDDARSLLTVPALAQQVQWADEALALILDECRGHPYLLQLLGSATWRVGQPRAGDTLRSEHVRGGIPEARDQLDAMYRARWASATPAEQAFIRSMAQVGADHVTRAAIAAGLGQSSSAISVPRERLIEKGVIEPVGHGLVRFTLPGFGDFARDRAQ